MSLEPEKQAQEVPIEAVQPVVVQSGWGPQLIALAKYMTGTEVHTYAFSVAANVILSLFPFIVLLLTISRQVFHSPAMESVVGDLMTNLLPTGQAFVMRNAHPQKGMQVFSMAMLLVSSTGVFLPLEVALNGVWGVKKNRNYLHNQVVSLGLAAAVGALALLSVGMTAGQQSLMRWVFLGHTDNFVYRHLAGGLLNFFAIAASILLFFLIYWILPNRKIAAQAVIPTAIVIGLLWEVAKYLYVLALPKLDLHAVYGPFYISVGLMMWAFLSGLLLLAGAHFSATRYAIVAAREAERQ
jgi:membrane protein